MKLLLSAFACEPGQGSERGVGWNWAIQAARLHEVWVLTNEVYRPAIETELASNPRPHLHFLYCDVPRWGYWFKRTGPSHKPYYYIWQLFALRTACAYHRRIRFDLIHHVTYNTIDVPGFLWLLNTRFVWGPVGGGQVPPRVMRRYFRHHWIVEELRAMRKRLLRFSPVVRAAIRHADHILAANHDTEVLLRKLGATHISRLLEAGCELPPETIRPRYHVTGPVCILWSGQLTFGKAPLLALQAFETLVRRGVNARLILTGDGPLRDQVHAFIARHGLAPYVLLPGWVAHSRMNELYREVDIFLFSSLRDTSGNVVLEAMSHGLPIVALDHQGVAEMASDGAGILVSVHSPEQVIFDLAVALEELTLNPTLRRKLGSTARGRVERLYTWECKGHQLGEIYASVLSSTPEECPLAFRRATREPTSESLATQTREAPSRST